MAERSKRAAKRSETKRNEAKRVYRKGVAETLSPIRVSLCPHQFREVVDSIQLKSKGDPPALPGRQQKFDGSGSLVLAPYRPPSSDCRQPQAIEGRSYIQTLLRSGLLLLCDCDQAPLRGQQS